MSGTGTGGHSNRDDYRHVGFSCWFSCLLEGSMTHSLTDPSFPIAVWLWVAVSLRATSGPPPEDVADAPHSRESKISRHGRVVGSERFEIALPAEELDDP